MSHHRSVALKVFGHPHGFIGLLESTIFLTYIFLFHHDIFFHCKLLCETSNFSAQNFHVLLYYHADYNALQCTTLLTNILYHFRMSN